jgi:hypothetical protein
MVDKNQKRNLKEKLTRQKSWFLLSFSYSPKVRGPYILLYKSILEQQDQVKNKWQSLIRTIGGKGE